MRFNIEQLNDEQLEVVEGKLEAYDKNYITFKIDGDIHLGAFSEGELVGGIDACMTAFHILYVSTLFVEEAHRGKGIGKALLQETEKQAKELGANMIRLDTFDWQGRDFYLALGYEQVGSYTNDIDGFSEYFFVKRI
jgi:GNAT superfamily N-acetyltransferase